MPDNALWTVEELVGATGGTPHGTVSRALTGVSIDSRSLDPGDIFFAIIGENSDGHRHVGAALDAGAAIAVVSDPAATGEADGAMVVVDDTLHALEALGRAARERCGGTIMAVTGSVGKTGTKEALRLCFEGQGATHASVASYNNHWGVPLTLARMPRDTRYGIFEVGMNHPGEITPLVAMIRPHIAIVTTVQPVHIEAFASVEAIADAKAEIFSGLEPGGTAILNRDNPHFERLRAAAAQAGAARIITFGRDPSADVRLSDAVLDVSYSTVTATVEGTEMTYKLGAPGEHLVLNSLGVLAVVHAAGGDLALAGLSLADVRPPKGRGAQLALQVPGGTATLIDESYNANPASMRAALALLGMGMPGAGGRRIAVMGDMLELGSDGPRLHTELAPAIDDAKVDIVYACGPNMAHFWEAVADQRRGVYAETPDGLKEPLLDVVRAGDVIMIKGSLGSRMGPLVEALCDKFKPLVEAENSAA